MKDIKRNKYKNKSNVSKVNKQVFIFILMLIIICSTIGVAFASIYSAEPTGVKVNYISEETNITVTKEISSVDGEIGNGRVWITDLTDVQSSNAEFKAPENKYFIGWKYKSSVIGGSTVTKTSAYAQGDHFTQNEYYSLSENETEINVTAVWGYKVYVDGVNGIDDSDGLSSSTPVRTMGRAYEVLARLDSGNENANITGFSVSGNSTTGYTYNTADTANFVKNFNGKIIVMNNINYSNQYEGRYEYITYGDLINHPSYNATAGTLTFNDGVADRKFSLINKATGYSEDDPVKFGLSSGVYQAKVKTASGTLHYMLKKVVNSYSYEVGGKTYYTYGRLTQYTENLRAHVGKGLMSPENEGLVLITSKDDSNNYSSSATFEFGDYTRYASGGDLIYKDIQIAFFHDSKLDVESPGYVAGYAANGNYLAIDDNVNVIKDTTHINVNIYGGGHRYRYNSLSYTGSKGSNLGNAGLDILTNTRLTVKSGTWTTAYGGSYGLEVGRAVNTYGKTENNASVVNIYGGTYTSGVGMGHEGASAHNSYVYVYGGTFATVHGSGLGSSGAMKGSGITNVLITGENTVVTGNVLGGSTNGSHTGDINLVIKNGDIRNTIYGGNSKTMVTGSIKILITGGKMKSITGGCQTGSITGTVSVHITGGTITGDIYASGQGGTQEDTTQYFVGATDDGTTNAQILNSADPRLNILVTGDTSVDANVIQSSVKVVNSSATQHHNDNTYTIGADTYYYPQIYSADYSHLLAGHVRGTYKQHGPTQYTVQRRTSFLSLATVQGVELNITGGTIKGNIYGGGKVAVVEGDVSINISNANITGNIFGGGDGSYEPTVNLYTATSASTYKTEKYTWKGSETFDISQYDTVKNIPIDMENKYIYSPTYDYMGGVNGNVYLTIDEASVITGTVYGGGNEGLVTGSVNMNISNATVTKNIYGGGNVGHVTNGIEIIANNAEIAKLFGGGYSGKVGGSVSLNIDDSQINELFGGGYSGIVEGDTSVIINSGNYTNVFGGCDQAVVKGNTLVNVGNDENLFIDISGVVYGGGRGVDADSDGDASDFCTVEGKSEVTIKGMNTVVQNYGSTKLGSVSGDVNVTFDTYRKNNSTNPYVTMNGIDRATVVSLINSYIALENIGENGEKEGIKNIGTLNVPAGSGLKVTANGEISRDFNGGGSFYLNSRVSLIVGGNITGETELVINPQISQEEDNIDSPLIIKGTLAYPYLIVKGDSNEANIVCNDVRYADKSRYYYGDVSNVTAGYFYLESDIAIYEQIHQDLVSKELINYTEDAGTWGNEEKVEIRQDGIFTTNMNLIYNFAVDNSDTNSYRNLGRYLVIKESSMDGEMQSFPAGAIITMIADGEYYKYTLQEAMQEVPLDEFVYMEDRSIKYDEVKNILDDQNTILEGKTSKSVIYSRTEGFRFVIDLTYTEKLLPTETYIVYLNIKNDEIDSSALDLLSENIIEVKPMRKYVVTVNSEEKNYLEKCNILVDVGLEIEGLDPIENDEFLGFPLYSRVTLKDKEGNAISLPANTLITIENSSVPVDGGVGRVELVDSLSRSSYNKQINVNIDMTNIADYSFKVGKYEVTFDTILKNSISQKTIDSQSIEINIVRPEGGNILIESTASNLNGEGVLEPSGSTTETLKIKYYGNIESPYVKVKVQGSDINIIKNGAEKIEDLIEDAEKTVNIDLNKLGTGEHKVMFELYDKEGKLYSTSVVLINC